MTREVLLARVREACGHRRPRPQPFPAPDLEGGWQRFRATLESVGCEAAGPIQAGSLTATLSP